MYNQYDKAFLITMGNSVRENDLSVQ